MMPVVMAPALIVLFWADVKAKKAHILSFSASNYAARTDKREHSSVQLLLYLHISIVTMLTDAFLPCRPLVFADGKMDCEHK